MMKTRHPAAPSLKKTARTKPKETAPSLKKSPQREPAGAGSAAKDLRRYHAFLDALMDNISDYIYFKDLDSRFLRINAAHARAFGLRDPAEAIGKTDFDFFTDVHAHEAFMDEQEIIRTGRPIIGLVEEETRADGRVSWVSTTKMPLHDDRGQIIGTFGISRDVTAQKLAEDSLRRSERLQRDILSNMSDWVWETDPSGTYMFSSEKAEALFGVPNKDIIGKSAIDFLQAEDVPRVKAYYRDVLANKSIIRDFERWCVGRDGQRICLLSNGVPILDERGNLLGFRGADKDVTKYKQAEKEINRQLEEKNILLKEVHHRIKNNIAAIASVLSLHLRSTSNPEAVAVLKEVLGRVKSMGILYDNLLIGEGYRDISMPKYVESLVASVISLFPEQPKVDLALRVDDFSLGSKWLFPLGIILNEILTNTMKYAFVGRERGAIRLSITCADGRVTLILQDDGRGLPAGFALENSKGFGLMLVKMLSEQLDGSFSIVSDKGTFSTLTFKV
jgi:PAS domain S-box-containing protein